MARYKDRLLFSQGKYVGVLIVGTVVAIVAAVCLPAGLANASIILFVSGVALLVLRSTYWTSKHSKGQYLKLITSLTEFRAENAVKFGENEARVRQLGVLARQAEVAMRQYAEAQNVKFGENEARVRQLGVLARQAEASLRSVSDAANVASDGESEEIQRLATIELRFQILEDLAAIRQGLIELKPAIPERSFERPGR